MHQCRTTTNEVFSEMMCVHVGQKVRRAASMGSAGGSAGLRRGSREGNHAHRQGGDHGTDVESHTPDHQDGESDS